MKARSITYEDFLKLNPCWLQDNEKAKLMEEIGKRRTNWTALDVLNINHEEVTSEDKLWVLIIAKLISKKQITRAMLIFIQCSISHVRHTVACKSNQETVKQFDELLGETGFKRFESMVETYIGVNNPSSIDDKFRYEEQYRKHVKDPFYDKATSCYNRLSTIFAMLRDDRIKIDKGVDVLYLIDGISLLTNLMNLISSDKTLGRQLIFSLSSYTGNPPGKSNAERIISIIKEEYRFWDRGYACIWTDSYTAVNDD